MTRWLTVLFGLIFVLCAGCDPADDTEPQAETKTTETSGLLTRPYLPVVVELLTEALPQWRQLSGEKKPRLVYFAKDPMLEVVPEELAVAAMRLVQNGTEQEVRLHGNTFRAEPYLVDNQVAGIAADAGLVSELIWCFPSTHPIEEEGPAEQQMLETLALQLIDSGLLTEDEADTLKISRGVVTGIVRGLPFKAVHPDALSSIKDPDIVHFDLGYFKGLYSDAIKTPIYDVINRVATSVKDAHWQPELVTLSYSTEDGTYSLDSRFVVSNFSHVIQHPDHLEQGKMPEAWSIRAQALHSVNFFMDDEVRKLYEKAAEKFPEDATVQYDMFRQKVFSEDKLEEGLVYLEKAIALDPGYAAAYLELSQLAAGKGQRYDIAADMLGKAAPFFPNNPFIDLYRADFLLTMGFREDAKPLIQKLESLTWSKTFHADIPEILQKMREVLGEE